MAVLSKYFIESENIGIYEQIFESVTIIDAHTHAGADLDGHKMSVNSLLKSMKENGVNKSFIFPLNDPRAGKNFSFPNERIFRAFRKHPERFIPFFRLDPNHDWKGEFDKRVRQGFKGVKLHPLAQNFRIASSSAMNLYERIEKNNLMLLVHCGFGVDKVAEDLLKVLKRFRHLKLVIGHGGFSDLGEALKLLRERQNVFFETSAMRFFDLVELLSAVSYKRIVFGSDIPYYDQTLSLQMLVDSSNVSGYSPNQIRWMLGGNIEKWLK